MDQQLFQEWVRGDWKTRELVRLLIESIALERVDLEEEFRGSDGTEIAKQAAERSEAELWQRAAEGIIDWESTAAFSHLVSKHLTWRLRNALNEKLRSGRTYTSERIEEMSANLNVIDEPVKGMTEVPSPSQFGRDAILAYFRDLETSFRAAIGNENKTSEDAAFTEDEKSLTSIGRTLLRLRYFLMSQIALCDPDHNGDPVSISAFQGKRIEEFAGIASPEMLANNFVRNGLFQFDHCVLTQWLKALYDLKENTIYKDYQRVRERLNGEDPTFYYQLSQLGLLGGKRS